MPDPTSCSVAKNLPLKVNVGNECETSLDQGSTTARALLPVDVPRSDELQSWVDWFCQLGTLYVLEELSHSW